MYNKCIRIIFFIFHHLSNIDFFVILFIIFFVGKESWKDLMFLHQLWFITCDNNSFWLNNNKFFHVIHFTIRDRIRRKKSVGSDVGSEKNLSDGSSENPNFSGWSGFFPKRWSDRFRITENNEICSFKHFLDSIKYINAESVEFQQKLCL